ncbi:flavodoxin domain-containing protein [Cellulomonas sp. PhB150]|uniref:flavodoxin domain-containing protein n=1 Tax=Cellulomonas sp. PhB150 TaxID=2485188 RepID=UPI000FC00382|nr:flavodoxin domain-containing protein [Cellulomonas sp. PhB150]ROS31269.1 menaquinone-dependent protoporphyrinogen oxidase [Cellulomonas sp. PhB150]
MGAWVLVAVASRHGATQEIGEAVAQVLRARGNAVDVRDVEDVTDVAGYDAVVVGSAVYTAHWLPAARELVARERDALAARPVWLFSSGLATQPAAAANSPHEIAALGATIGARGHRSFRGRLDRSVLSFTERAIIAGARGRDGDHRDFPAIERWAAEIADVLADERASV